MKRAIEIVYGVTLPKASKPFIYMSITLPPEHVDVNVHPTKREVMMLLHDFYVISFCFIFYYIYLGFLPSDG